MNCMFSSSSIDYASIFNQEATLQESVETDSAYTSDDYSEDTITIKVRISGGDRFYYNDDNQLLIAERVYKTLHPVKPKDLLNGQVVVYVKTIYEFDGSLAFYKVYV